MPKTGIVISERYEQHDTGPHHPECPERIRAIRERLDSLGLWSGVKLIDPKEIDLSLVERVHAREYIDELDYACRKGDPFIDTPECPLCSVSFEIACLSAGGVIEAVDAVMAGEVQNVFCAVRPPGHHAEYGTAMGFCYFNNVAIAAQYLRDSKGIERVAIVDWDVHHGNGTQHYFNRNPDVLYVSVHQDPHTTYPGTGFDWETGLEEGTGATLNISMSPGSGDDEYRRAFEETILPKIGEFEPGFILISAGFDAHREDPLANIMLSTDIFGWMTRQLKSQASAGSNDRMVSVLEGGYNFRALADSVQAHIEVLGE